MKSAIYPGSFDPITLGHLHIIRRAALLFDELTVLISINPIKPASFSVKERKDFINRCVVNIPNVKVDICNGLLIDYFNKHNSDVIVKGLRAMSDFEYEFQMALVNKDLCEKAETIFLAADAASTFLSSSMVKQIATFGGDVSSFVPKEILADITARLRLDKTNISERNGEQ